MNHKKGYASAAEALRSKAAGIPGAVIDEKCPCGRVHVDVPKTPKAKADPPVRARPGAMTAAAALVLAGGATVAEAARQHQVDPERLEDRAGQLFRQAVMERDQWTCQHCGAMATEVQHVIARGAGGTSDPVVAFGTANGVALCRDSHLLAESRDPEMYRLGFWRRQGEIPGMAPIYQLTEYGRLRLWLTADGGTTQADPRRAAA